MGYDLFKDLGYMHVGIVELMETGHIALAESMCRIFCSDTRNKVFLFTGNEHAANLNFLKGIFQNLSIVPKPDLQKEEDFLNTIDSFAPDRVYVVTLNNLFPSFAAWKIKARLYLVIHNLDEWFGISILLGIRKYLTAILRNSHSGSMVYLLKVHFFYPFYKRMILNKVRQTSGSLVVLSVSVRKQLSAKTDLPVQVVPFSVFESSLVHFKSDLTGPLRICVPGILSQYRRNYLGLLDLIEKFLPQYKARFVIDFLGGVQPGNPLNETALLLERINNLKLAGFSIIVHNVKFIPPAEYDTELSLSDIILGNMNVVLNKYSEYGRTKETGLPFAMIKAAKPGILPERYPVPDELRSGVIPYKDYDDLGRILADLINNPEQVLELQQKAFSNSSHFSPEIIYNQLIS